MKLVWHIIKKDIRRMAWVFVMWAISGGYLIAYQKLEILGRSIWDNLGIVSLFTHAALTFALIAGIVQEDGLTEGNEFWRTRPISAGRQLAAKLSLILPAFVGVPACVILVQSWLYHAQFSVSDLRYIMPVMTVIVLCCTAMASCTKDLGRYFLGGIFCVVGVAMMGPWLVSWFHLEPLPKAAMMRVSRIYALFTFCGLAAVTLLLNQYFTRRTKISIGIVIGAVIGVTLIEGLWRWSFIVH
ncbi:MAG: hypothetical protein KBF26_07530 [Opitutaceae bacterium]|nr:hypothetical protein [Opitutaceae bacterium]